MRLKLKHIERMFQVANVVRFWSTCPSGRQHACVLARDGKYIISTGFNGLKKDCEHLERCCTWNKSEMLLQCKADHAEYNALFNNRYQSYPTDTVYAFVTKQPCKECFTILKQKGIKRVYWKNIIDGGIYIKMKRLN